MLRDIYQLTTEGFNVEIIKREDKFISIKIFNTDKNISITIKDSLLLLPSSLANLAKQF